jgi:hypothetical protein
MKFAVINYTLLKFTSLNDASNLRQQAPSPERTKNDRDGQCPSR